MSGDYLSSAPPFTIGDVTWRCWVTDGGQRYEWRSECGRFIAGRSGAEYWSRADGRPCGNQHHTLRAAMVAAIRRARDAA